MQKAKTGDLMLQRDQATLMRERFAIKKGVCFLIAL
jgi:hypothetical protein